MQFRRRSPTIGYHSRALDEADNPFDRYDLDPSSPPQAITERFRELVADARESERDALRAAWDALTLHPEDRVRAAFLAHPETRPALGDAPRRRRASKADDPSGKCSIAGLLVLPELVPLLDPHAQSGSFPDANGARDALPDFPLDLSDPALTEK